MQSLLTTISTGYTQEEKPVIAEEYIEEDFESIKKTVKTGFDETPVEPTKTMSATGVRFPESVRDTMNTGFDEEESQPAQLPEVPSVEVADIVFEESVKSTINTGYGEGDVETVQSTPPSVDVSDVTFAESVKETIDTGYGSGTLHKECKEPELVQYLERQNYLSEFKTELEKAKARLNLGVYSSAKVDQLLQEITNNVGGIYITLLDLNLAISSLDFVDSTLKAYADYEIPNNLFKL